MSEQSDYDRENLNELRTQIKRKDAQIKEAISILESGTEYEKIHVTSILSDAL